MAAVSPRRLRARPEHVDDQPLHDPTRTGIVLASTNVVLFSLMSLAQWAGWGGLNRASHSGDAVAVSEALAVMAVNLAYGLLVVGGTFALRPMRWGAKVRYPLIALVALVASVPRAVAMRAIYTTPEGAVYIGAEWLAGFFAGFLAVGAGVFVAAVVGRARREERRRLQVARRAARAVEELQSEEMRVRRMVSDHLHGNLQYRLVTVTAGLDGVAASLDGAGADPAAAAAQLRAWAERLEEIREQEVRTLSHAVFPAGVELGVVRAVDLMLRRLPPQIATSIQTGPGLRRFERLGQVPLMLADRLVAVYTIEEAVTNALKHGHASRVSITADVRPVPGEPERWVMEASVDDDGTGMPDTDVELHGLARHAERLETRGGHLTLGPSALGGTRLSFALPFERTTATLPTGELPVVPEH
ncbi:MAG: hypothetical protein FWF90_06420 [Promicromonosporaceae bacterium]|nr:hypothetical protein [Promicromonosporaceae bacterium]